MFHHSFYNWELVLGVRWLTPSWIISNFETHTTTKKHTVIETSRWQNCTTAQGRERERERASERHQLDDAPQAPTRLDLEAHWRCSATRIHCALAKKRFSTQNISEILALVWPLFTFTLAFLNSSLKERDCWHNYFLVASFTPPAFTFLTNAPQATLFVEGPSLLCAFLSFKVAAFLHFSLLTTHSRTIIKNSQKNWPS